MTEQKSYMKSINEFAANNNVMGQGTITDKDGSINDKITEQLHLKMKKINGEGDDILDKLNQDPIMIQQNDLKDHRPKTGLEHQKYASKDGQSVNKKSAGELSSFVDFGVMPIANAFATKEQIKNEYTFPMKVGFCDNCNMVQLVEQPDREKMFHENYAFFSSTSNYMKGHFKLFANSVSELQDLNKNSFVVEVGCNDGILLKPLSEHQINCLGVDPASNIVSVAKEPSIQQTVGKKACFN